MAHTEKCRGCLNENKCDYINCRLDSGVIDFDKMMEILHSAPISHGYAYEGSVQIKEPSYIITQDDMVKLFNYVRSVN